MSEPRYLLSLARARLAEAKAKVLDRSVSAGSHEAWILLFEAAEAASLLMADRAATLHALAHVYAVSPATGGMDREVAADLDVLAAFHFEATDGGDEDLRVVDAARMLADCRKSDGFSSAEDSARALLWSNGRPMDAG